MTKPKAFATAVYPGVVVKPGNEALVKELLGSAHWKDEVYKRYCGGRQSGVVKRMVGTGLALVQFKHSDGTTSMLTLPTGALQRCDCVTESPSLYGRLDEVLKPASRCIVCGLVGAAGERRASGYKCSTCIGKPSHRWGSFKKKRLM